ADTDAARVAPPAREFGAQTVAPDTIHTIEADIFAPCAIGGVLNAETIQEKRARMKCVAANNQLATPQDQDRLLTRGILYLPDYVANGGGIINVAAEILHIEDRAAWVSERLDAIRARTDDILTRAAGEAVSPAVIADRMVEEALLARAG
ncbi:MAG: amino acid dehydrogenase, partial [Roseovarius sp.]